jgi:hypothetical protein
MNAVLEQSRRYRRRVAIITGGVLGEHGAPGQALKAVMRRITAFAPRATEGDYVVDLGFFSWTPGVGPRLPGSPDGPGRAALDGRADTTPVHR